MKPAVSNATPLIYLAGIGRLDLLRVIFGKVLIPEEVKREVVDEGKRLGRPDAWVIEKALEDGWIEVHAAKAIHLPVALHPGEQAAVSLAKQKGVKVVLMDEPSARLAASLSGLEPRGTLYVLLQSLRQNELDLDGFLEVLCRLIEKGYRLREEVYLEVVRRARGIAERKGP